MGIARNKKWVKKIGERSLKNKSIFVFVGVKRWMSINLRILLPCTVQPKPRKYWRRFFLKPRIAEMPKRSNMPTDYLHNHKQFADLLRIIEDETEIQAGLVEKDYWIMHTCPQS